MPTMGERERDGGEECRVSDGMESADNGEGGEETEGRSV